MKDIKYANFARAERWAAPEPACISGDRRTYSFGEGLS